MGVIWKRISEKLNVQSFIVSMCILMVCVGTQQMQTVKWDTGKIEFFRDFFGVLMAFILFTHYKWNDFVKYKIPYIAWSVVGGVALIVGTPIAVSKRYEYLMWDTVIIAVGFFLMGYCLIHTYISFVVEKHRPKYYKPLFVIWIVMLLWMIFSETEYLWPECYFVLFGCYYLTEQTPTQRKNVVHGIVNGLLLAFMVIQGHAFLCRPYDMVRYKGNFCNPNHNCAFLCFCLVAIFSKILFLTKDRKKGKWQKAYRVLYFLMAGMCYSFICMTVSRSGYLATAVITVLFLVAYCRIRQKMFFFRMGALLVLIFALMLPTTYMAVRYLPTVHPHVLFYFQEQYSEELVHSYDSRDSEKFVSFEQLLTEVFGRFAKSLTDFGNLQEEPGNNVGLRYDGEDAMIVFPEFIMREFRMAMTENAIPEEMLKYVNPETGEIDFNKIPALEYEGENAFVVRYTIYKWYFDHLSLRGMPYDEQGFQLTEGHWIQDTHNIYLDYGINFGYPVMILFTIFVWWGIGRLCVKGFKDRDELKFACMLFAVLPPVFGLFEFIWGAGMIYTVAFYLAFREIFADYSESELEAPKDNLEDLKAEALQIR